MRKSTLKAACAFGIGLIATYAVQVSPVSAHHSFSAYDMTRVDTAKGTIKEFRWGAPHASAVVTVEKPDGTTKDLLLVGSAPNAFVKQGFNPKAIHIGDTVTVTWHPNRNGTDGGVIDTMVFPDGRTFRSEDTQAAAPPTN